MLPTAYVNDTNMQQTHPIDTVIRTGFKCDHVIIANCDFSQSAQLLERNVYITRKRTYVRLGVINTLHVHNAI